MLRASSNAYSRRGAFAVPGDDPTTFNKCVHNVIADAKAGEKVFEKPASSEYRECRTAARCPWILNPPGSVTLSAFGEGYTLAGRVTAYFAEAVRNFSGDFIVSPRRSTLTNGFCRNVATMELKRSGSSNGIMCVALAKISSCAFGM